MGKHGSQIKNDRTYEALRKKGASKNRAARIANAQATGNTPSRTKASKTTSGKGGRSGTYEEWSKDQLLSKARQVGIGGRSKMSKSQLAKALRDH